MTAVPPLRFALFLPNLDGGGAERVALALIQGLLDRGHGVDLVLARRTGVLLPLVPAEVNVFDLGVSNLRQAVLPLARYLRDRRPRTLHAMMWPLPMIAFFARAIARTDTRLVGSEHSILSNHPYGLRHRAVRALTRRVYRKLDSVITVSNGAAEDLSRLIGLPRDRIAVVYNPLILPDQLPDASVAAARWPADTKRILAVGTLKSEKNYALLLRALAMTRDHVSASLLILGDGPLRETLATQTAATGLADAVVFAGFEADPWPYYAAADVFVLSSDNEGLGNVLIEALHADLPVVSTDCPGGPREILQDGRFGQLVRCKDDDQLAQALVAVLRAPKADLGRRERAAALSGEAPIQQHMVLMAAD